MNLAGAQLSETNLLQTNLSGADLSGAELSGSNLSGANLTKANLMLANLSGAQLVQADLRNAVIFRTQITNALFTGSNLARAVLMDSNFFNVDVSNANMSGALMISARFTWSDFTGTVLTRANLGHTAFHNCPTLHLAEGLETAHHEWRSYLDRVTINSCVNGLPMVFLEGCGYTRHEIEQLRVLYANSPIRHYSCFISHAESDLRFAEHLLKDLRQNNVACWHYKRDMRGGTDWEVQIGEAVKDHDKLVLVCSRHAVYRKNVIREVLQALNLERETGEQKLFPIRLDNHIIGSAMLEEAREKVKSGEWAENWVYYVTKRHIPDFSGWETDDEKYQQEFKKLLEAFQKPP